MNSLTYSIYAILGNDLKIHWRQFKSGPFRKYSNTSFICLIFIALNALSILHFTGSTESLSFKSESLLWLSIAYLLFSSSLAYALRVLFEQNDLDLILSSPVPKSVALLTRIVAISLSAALSISLLLAPCLNGLAAAYSVSFLWGYLVWLLVAGIMAALSATLCTLATRLFGHRRARVGIQVAFVSVSTLGGLAILFSNLRVDLLSSLGSRIAVLPIWSLLVNAAHGDWTNLLVLSLISAGTIVLSSRFLAHSFIVGLNGSHARAASATTARPLTFCGSLFSCCFRRDLRLLARDPLLLLKVFQPVLILTPILLLADRGLHMGPGCLFAAFMVPASMILSSKLSSNLQKDDASMDFVMSSPASRVHMLAARACAAMIAPLFFNVVIAVVIAGTGNALCATIGLSTATVCAFTVTWIELCETWEQATAKRRMVACSIEAPTILHITFTAILLLFGCGSVIQFWKSQWGVYAFSVSWIGGSAIICLGLVRPRDGGFYSERCTSPSAINFPGLRRFTGHYARMAILAPWKLSSLVVAEYIPLFLSALFFGWFFKLPVGNGVSILKGPWSILVFSIIAPLLETVVFQWLFCTLAVRLKRGYWTQILVGWLPFAAMHFYSRGVFTGIIAGTIFGYFLSYLFVSVRPRSTLQAFAWTAGVHMLNNTCAALIGLLGGHR